jgi:hypothetical protein
MSETQRVTMKQKYILYTEVIFFIVFSIFSAILYFGISTDIQTHIGVVERTANGAIRPPANFLYYLTVYAFTFFQTNLRFLRLSSVLVLSLAVIAKFVITYKFVVSHKSEGAEKNLTPEWFTLLFCTLLLFAFSLPTNAVLNGRFYLGQFPPNVWHNSTTIFLMPFALLLFWLSYEQLKKPTQQRIFLITLFCVLNILIKPNFCFVFFLVYPIMLVWRFGLKKELWLNCIPIIVGAVLFIGEYYLIFVFRFGNPGATQSNLGIAISLFSVWSRYSSNIAISLLVSILFPLVYMCIYWRELFENLLLQYAVLLYLAAIAITSIFTETGPRQTHGNFIWQSIVCTYILFMVVSTLFIGKVKFVKKGDWLNKVILMSFLLHVVSGFAYLAYFFATKSYR